MARLRHLVVVIPGIGGSVLSGPTGPAEAAGAAENRSGGVRDEPGRVRYELSAPGLAGALMSPGQLDVGRHPQLTPTGLVHDFTVLPPLLTLPGYQRLNLHLRNAFDDVVISTYRPPEPIHEKTDVLRFPYDFRLSVAAGAERLDAAVTEALRHRPMGGDIGVGAGAHDRPVIIVAHSMGGLLARYWIAVLDGWRHCAALITLGTPHRGAPKALDWLVNGAGVGVLRDPRATRVIRGWPSMYELLPQYEAVWDTGARGGRCGRDRHRHGSGGHR